MSSNPIFVASYRSVETQLLNNMKAAVVFQAGANGSRIHNISASQDDTGTPTISLYRGKSLTNNASAGLALTNTTNSTITRSSGSFITDGWVHNMALFTAYALVAPFTDTWNLLNQVVAHINAVTSATTLTFSGTVFNAADASPPSSLNLIQANLLWAKAMTASAGNADANPSIDLLDPVKYPSLFDQPDTFLMLGPNELLIAVTSSAPAALKSISILVDGGDY